MILPNADRLPPRRGAILLVVMTLTALFAVIALSFALYSESAANSSRINREAAATYDGPPPADAMAIQFLNRTLFPLDAPNASYGTTNDVLFNGIRGFSHGEMVYGNNPAGGNTVAYNGIGTFNDTALVNVPTATGTIAALDRRNVMNFAVQIPRDAAGNIVANSVHVIDPEHTGFRTSVQVRTATGLAVSPADTTQFVPGTATAKFYVGRNAPYTYPDRLNAYVAVQDANTGRVLIPSYHRPSLFASFSGGMLPLDRSLDSSNPNWRDTGDPTGRYKILRPRPYDHRLAGETEAQSQFPFPPLNPDGTVTGDVQNIPTTDGVQRNDALWIDANLPVVQWRGRKIKALIAPTILPLDARVNANVAGLKSNHGFGPWEMNLARITSDAATMVNARFASSATPPAPRGVTSTPYNFAYPTAPNAASLVDWNANATQRPFYPGDANDPDVIGYNAIKATVSYSSLTGMYGEAGEGSSHPGSFNPYAWNSFTNNAKLFSFADLRRSSVKFSGQAGDYAAPFFGPTPPGTLTGSGVGSPSNALRALLTTTSNSLARPRLGPNFRDYTSQFRTVIYAPGAGLAVAYDPNPVLAAPDQQLQIPFPITSPPNGGAPANWVTDYSASPAATTAIDTYKAVAAALGGLDLNRPLTDYRVNPNAPLADPSNVGGAMAPKLTQALTDRTQFAREIFARLILAVGAKAQVVNSTTILLPVETPAMSGMYMLNTSGGGSYPVQPAEYEALRYLAQIAVNIVDYVDNDDIITPFNWNPADTTGGTVLGVEKPRLVINEVYSEITNDPSTPTGKFQVKYWVELMNTSNTDTSTSPLAGPTGSGAPAGSVPLQLNGGSVYRIEVYKQGANAVNQMGTSPLGDASGGGQPDIQADAGNFSNMATPTYAQWVEPNNGYLVANAGGRNGIAVFGPKPPATPGANDYSPTNPTMLAGNGNGMGGTPSTDLSYTVNFGPTSPTSNNSTVLLRRLVNPYIPFDPMNNPYVTVDYMTSVFSENAVQNVQGMGLNPTMPNPNAPTPIAQRKSQGRVQPYCGKETLAAGAMPPRVAAYPNSLVVPQQNSIPMQPQLSLFQQNYATDITMTMGKVPPNDPTLRAPFEWLVHLDRQLINQVELLHVAGCKNFELTHNFATPNAMGNPLFHQHTAYAPTLAGTSNAPLYRALELLSVKPWGYALPDGGRVPGKVNINMIRDKRVLEALLDQSTASPNAVPSFQGADVDLLWATLFTGQTSDSSQAFPVYSSFARSKSPTDIGPTVDEIGPTYVDNSNPTTPVTRGADQPFKPLGTPTFAAGGALLSGSGQADTILRINPTTGRPAILPPTFNNPLITNFQEYQKGEMLRKMYNSVTTTSDTYLVVMTVGYFEVRNDGPYNVTDLNLPINPVVLGREVFNEVPTDMRAKFVAVVDRSMLATDNPLGGVGNQADGVYISGINEAPYDPTATIPPPPGPAGLFYIRFPAQGLDSTGKIVVAYEGRNVSIGPGDTIVLGTGASQEILTIGSLGGFQPYTYPGPPPYPAPTAAPPYDSSTGLACVQIQQPPGPMPGPPQPPAKFHAGGSMISNAILGNPGPQPNFDVNQPRYKGVVPFFDRITLGQ